MWYRPSSITAARSVCPRADCLRTHRSSPSPAPTMFPCRPRSSRAHPSRAASPSKSRLPSLRANCCAASAQPQSPRTRWSRNWMASTISRVTKPLHTETSRSASSKSASKGADSSTLRQNQAPRQRPRPTLNHAPCRDRSSLPCTSRRSTSSAADTWTTKATFQTTSRAWIRTHDQ